jgi:hypothetical protein
LYDIGLTSPNQDSRVLYNQIAFSNSCNFNNVYVYSLPRATSKNKVTYLTPAQKSLIISSSSSKKPLTADVIIMDPVYKTLTVGYKLENETNVNTILEQSRLVIKLERTAKLTADLIRNKVVGIFQSFFDPAVLTLGYTVNIVDLTAYIKDIPGVKAVYSQRIDTGEIIEGISLAIWNPSYPINDLTSTTKNFTLAEFQALYFYDIETLASRIVVQADVSQDTSVVNL